MVCLSDIQKRRDVILSLAKERGAENVRVFGSVLHGTARENSDLDLLVTMAPDRSLLDRIALRRELQDLLHMPVDLVNDRALHPEIRSEVLAEAVAL